MTKIDLSGNSGWQSKSGDKLKALQNGSYDQTSIILNPDDINLDWIEDGSMVHIESGSLNLILGDDRLLYEKGDIIIFNKDNTQNCTIEISEIVKLQIFKSRK